MTRYLGQRKWVRPAKITIHEDRATAIRFLAADLKRCAITLDAEGKLRADRLYHVPGNLQAAKATLRAMIHRATHNSRTYSPICAADALAAEIEANAATMAKWSANLSAWDGYGPVRVSVKIEFIEPVGGTPPAPVVEELADEPVRDLDPAEPFAPFAGQTYHTAPLIPRTAPIQFPQTDKEVEPDASQED
jgi:hypothetical protein